jgi:hypothetical protein
MTDYQKLVMNPCTGALTKSLTGGSSLVERTRTSITLLDGAPTVNGYMVWFPSYVGDDKSTDYSPANWYYYVNADSTVKPTNTAAAPLGCNTASTTGLWLRDPAQANLETDGIFSTAKTVSACLTMDYIGQLNEAKGQFCVVRNLEASNLMSTTIRSLDFPTVDEMFDYAAVRGRLPLEGHEVIWRPSEADSKARALSVPSSAGTLIDALFRTGSVTNYPSVLNDPDPGEARGIVIAWRGVPQNSLVFNAVKVAEYTLKFKSKAVEMPVSMPTPGFSIDAAVAQLDKFMPGWQDSALRGAQHAAREAASRYILPSMATFLSSAGSTLRIMDGSL